MLYVELSLCKGSKKKCRESTNRNRNFVNAMYIILDPCRIYCVGCNPLLKQYFKINLPSYPAWLWAITVELWFSAVNNQSQNLSTASYPLCLKVFVRQSSYVLLFLSTCKTSASTWFGRCVSVWTSDSKSYITYLCFSTVFVNAFLRFSMYSGSSHSAEPSSFSLSLVVVFGRPRPCHLSLIVYVSNVWGPSRF